MNMWRKQLNSSDYAVMLRNNQEIIGNAHTFFYTIWQLFGKQIYFNGSTHPGLNRLGGLPYISAAGGFLKRCELILPE